MLTDSQALGTRSVNADSMKFWRSPVDPRFHVLVEPKRQRAASWAASDAECQDMWKQADANGDGMLSDRESLRYLALMRVADRTVSSEGRITRAEFMVACKADVYAPRKADPGAPLKGANSFTEGQAKDRALAHGGVESVSDLEKDDDGIWRGKAMQGGKAVEIAVDYKGNVVTTAQQ